MVVVVNVVVENLLCLFTELDAIVADTVVDTLTSVADNAEEILQILEVALSSLDDVNSSGDF